MFEQFTEEYFMEQAREMGDSYGVDTREGSVFMDAATGHCIRTAKFMNDLRTVFEMLAVDSCSGEILTEKAAQDGIFRQYATPAYYNVEFEGTTPDVGTRFFVDSYFFVLVMENDTFYLQSEETGIGSNDLEPGRNVIPVYNVAGLVSCKLGELHIPGTDEEKDESLRERWQDKKKGPSQNNNRHQYKSWCEERTGVGRAHIFPLYGGENTVMAVLYSEDGGLPTKGVIDDVQQYIDPIVEGYKVSVNGKMLVFGDGLGDGVSDLGAHFLAMAPAGTEILVTFSADLRNGYSRTQAQEEVLNGIKEYFKSLVIDGDEEIIVRVSSIGNIISQANSILDYSPASIRLNGSAGNIVVGKESTPIAKEVLIDA